MKNNEEDEEQEVKEDKKDESNKEAVLVPKVSAARSASEQSADVSDAFKSYLSQRTEKSAFSAYKKVKDDKKDKSNTKEAVLVPKVPKEVIKKYNKVLDSDANIGKKMLRPCLICGRQLCEKDQYGVYAFLCSLDSLDKDQWNTVYGKRAQNKFYEVVIELTEYDDFCDSHDSTHLHVPPNKPLSHCMNDLLSFVSYVYNKHERQLTNSGKKAVLKDVLGYRMIQKFPTILKK